MLPHHVLQLPFWQQQKATRVGDRDELAQANWLLEGCMVITDPLWDIFLPALLSV